MAIRRRQTSRLAETCLTLRVKIVILVSKINKYQLLYIFLLLKIERYIVIIFTHFLVKTKQKKTLKNQICVDTPVVTLFIFYYYLQYHLKAKCPGTPGTKAHRFGKGFLQTPGQLLPGTFLTFPDTGHTDTKGTQAYEGFIILLILLINPGQAASRDLHLKPWAT